MSFECVDSYSKIFLILNPPLENFTTRTAITVIALSPQIYVILLAAVVRLLKSNPMYVTLVVVASQIRLNALIIKLWGLLFATNPARLSLI